MNEKHMQYILAVLREGSVTAAAKKLYISQPSLSQAIKAAEVSLGAPIFDRTTEPMTLTPAGQLYVEAARQISAINRNLSGQIEELKHEDFGTLRFGIPVQRSMELLPLLYSRFSEQFPHVTLELSEQGSADLEQSVLEGRVDIACMTTSPKHEELYYELLKEEHLVLLANRRCAIAGRIPSGTPIDILEARDETFICSRPGHSVRALQDSLFISREIKPKIGLETVSIEVGKRVAATAEAVMICPDSYVDAGDSAPWAVYPILGVELPRHFYACRRRDLYLTRYRKAFLSLLHEAAGRPDHIHASERTSQHGI